MKTYSVAEAKAKFSEVLELAASGEDVRVTKYGKPYVQLATDTDRPRKSFDWKELDALRQMQPRMDISVVDLISQTRRDVI